MAASSVNELLQAVQRPRALSESGNRPFRRKSGGADEKNRAQSQMRRKSEHVPPARRLSLESLSEIPEKKHKKTGRRSFMGYKSFHSMTVIATGFLFLDHFN